MKEIKLEPMVLLEDEPVPNHEVDELGLEPFARVVAGTAVGTPGPFTIGVFADWGAGKTSLLKQAKSLIEANPECSGIVTVWFNAWQYEKEDHPIVPLIAAIVRSIEEKTTDEEGKLNELGKVLKAIAYAVFEKTSVKLPGGIAEIGSGLFEEIKKQYKELQSSQEPLLGRSLYYNAFDVLDGLSESEGSERPKIVVFIDDLDRCLPRKVLYLLESMKLVLCQPGFIFVLAVDRRIIERYLSGRFEEYGTNYLDKIIQLPFALPSHRSRFKSYIKELLKRDIFKTESMAPVKDALEGLTDVMAIGSNHNPRNLVRFINNIIVDRSIWISGSRRIDAEILKLFAVTRILQQYMKIEVYRRLVV